jgi:hypothetical protein
LIFEGNCVHFVILNGSVQADVMLWIEFWWPAMVFLVTFIIFILWTKKNQNKTNRSQINF